MRGERFLHDRASSFPGSRGIDQVAFTTAYLNLTNLRVRILSIQWRGASDVSRIQVDVHDENQLGTIPLQRQPYTWNLLNAMHDHARNAPRRPGACDL